jgi:hypothetical protein
VATKVQEAPAPASVSSSQTRDVARGTGIYTTWKGGGGRFVLVERFVHVGRAAISYEARWEGLVTR